MRKSRFDCSLKSASIGHAVCSLQDSLYIEKEHVFIVCDTYSAAIRLFSMSWSARHTIFLTLKAVV